MSRIGLFSLARTTAHLDSRQSVGNICRLHHRSYLHNVSLHLAKQVCHQSRKKGLFLCQGSASDNHSSQDGIQVDISVSGMMCDGCTSRIEEEIGKNDSVVSVQADLESGMVSVTVSVENFGDAAECMKSLIQDINEMGFEAKPSM